MAKTQKKSKKARPPSRSPIITRDMTINQVLEIHPKAAQIMQQFGLHCFGCSINVLETLEQGIVGHGMPASILKDMLEALNGDYARYKTEIAEKGVYLSEGASLKIVEIAKMEGRTSYGIRVKMLDSEAGCNCKPMYSMDFEEHAEEGDKILGFHHGVTLFKIENPNVVKSGENCGCHAGA